MTADVGKLTLAKMARKQCQVSLIRGQAKKETTEEFYRGSEQKAAFKENIERATSIIV